MDDSTEKSNKLHAQSAHVPHFPFTLPIFDSLLQALMAILGFLRFKLQHVPYDSSSDSWKPSSPKVSLTDGSDLPSTVTDRSAPVTLLSRRVPQPPRSRGGGSQTKTNRVSRPPRSRGRGGQTN